MKNVLLKQYFLAFSSPEVRFLIDSTSCSNKNLTNAMQSRTFMGLLFFLEIILDCCLLSQNKLTGLTGTLHFPVLY